MVSGLTEAQKKKLMLADNRIFDLGVDDLSVFEAFVQDLKDDLDIPGYEEDLLRAMVMDAEEASQALCEYGIIEQEQADTIIETHQRYEVQDTQVLPSIRKHGMYVVDQLISNPDLAIQAFTALKEEREQRKALESQIEKDAPKVLFADAVAASHTSILTGELAKLLKQNGVEIGQNRLFAWLRDNGYLIRRKGSDYNMPTQKSMEMELFEVKERTIHDPNGSVRVIKTPKVTGKGQQYFINKFLGVPAQ